MGIVAKSGGSHIIFRLALQTEEDGYDSMGIWSGSTVKESEITDVPAYNRANGIMWICFSLIYWTAAVLGIFSARAAGPVIGVGTLVGIVGLIVAYKAIYKKYRR